MPRTSDPPTTRIAALERDAETLRRALLTTPVFALDDHGLHARFEDFGRTALALFRETARLAAAEEAIQRIEAAYHRVHEALQAVATLALSDMEPGFPAHGNGTAEPPPQDVRQSVIRRGTQFS
ncbi:hypothetical protein D3093_26980 (plasmid) [Azospirillum argentinense]|uniref:Uncharacterized protein n=1 Tax=Azospirillum argentinense TaxID=2970906 RepID=A0A4D8PL24_9PROT|nr:hypothetical protein [Azospirillum argentinense]QCN98932.1 hypothetical protein D3093_26980 [Azospirillum argentinense]